MVQHAPRIDEIERPVRKWQAFGIGHAQVGDKREFTKPLTRMLDSARGQVHARTQRAALGKLLVICP